MHATKSNIMKQISIFGRISVLFWMLMAANPANLFAQEARFPANPYFLPPVFDGNFPNDSLLYFSAPDGLGLTDAAPQWDAPLPPPMPRQEFIDRLRKEAFRHYLRNNITSVHFSYADFSEKAETMEQIRASLSKNPFKVIPEYAQRDFNRSTRYTPKRKYWLTSWTSFLQFSQNYISKNWHSGGVGNQNLISAQTVTLNYAKNKVQFNNLIEWKWSFYTNPNDTLRSFRIGEDLVRIYSDFGLKAFNDKFFYSSNIEIKTRLFRGYKENSPYHNSAFLSPLNVNVGVFGIRYQLNKTSKKDKNKKLNINIDMSPLALQYIWVADTAVFTQNRYGIPVGDHSLLDVGSTLNAKIVVNFNKQITFSSRIKYFTNYKKALFEAENELNMSINRYFSTRLYLYGRFDDTPNIKRDDRLGLVQLNEVLSFGFKYTW